ncbi:MAG: LptF/LptG family permease [Thermodesulfovibrio sp.]|nr:LptF/LptG family permease [Thermodesulfovibrio sp.]
MIFNRVCINYIKDFIKTFLMLIISMSLLLSVIGLVDKIDDFVQYKPPAIFFIKYVIYMIPRYVFYLIPFVTLISSLFIFSMGVRNREFLILSVAGGRLRQTLKPFIFLGIVVSLLGFIFGEFIQPEYTKKINNMISELTEKRKVSLKRDIYLKGKGETIVNIGSFYQDKELGNDIKIYLMENNILVKRIDSKEADITDKVWLLKNVIIYDFNTGKIEKLDNLSYPVNVKISIASFKDIKKIEEFSLGELIKKRKELKAVGLNNPKIDTDISGKLSYNFVTFFMMILGISLPLGAYEKFTFIISRIKGVSGSSGVITVGIGLIITIIYWLIYSFFMFMGYSKILPPFIAPWITPVIFGFISLKLYYSIRE